MDHVSTHDHGNSVVVPTADRPPVNAPRANKQEWQNKAHRSIRRSLV